MRWRFFVVGLGILSLIGGLTACNSLINLGFNAADQAQRTYQVDRSKGWVGERFSLFAARGPQESRWLWIEVLPTKTVALLAPLSEVQAAQIFAPPNQAEASPATTDQSAPIHLELQKLVLSQNWSDGWSSLVQDLVGRASLTATAAGWRLQLEPGLENLEIEEAWIRSGDVVLNGNRALQQMANRQARVEALAAALRAKSQESFPRTRAVWSSDDSKWLPGFQEAWQNQLFPELAPPDQRPADWPKFAAPRSDSKPVIDYAESIQWNRRYSEEFLPANLVEIRQTGTMLRDWEESLQWIHALYEWPRTQAELVSGAEAGRWQAQP